MIRRDVLLASDDREVDLGRVRTWQPARRLVLDFYPGTSAEAPTEVVVELAPEGERTRVTVTHRPGRAGELWTQRAPRFAESWTAVLDALAVAAADVDA